MDIYIYLKDSSVTHLSGRALLEDSHRGHMASLAIVFCLGLFVGRVSHAALDGLELAR